MAEDNLMVRFLDDMAEAAYEECSCEDSPDPYCVAPLLYSFAIDSIRSLGMALLDELPDHPEANVAAAVLAAVVETNKRAMTRAAHKGVTVH